MEGLQNCLDNKVLTGVCTSLCQSNYDDLLQEKGVDRAAPSLPNDSRYGGGQIEDREVGDSPVLIHPADTYQNLVQQRHQTGEWVL